MCLALSFAEPIVTQLVRLTVRHKSKKEGKDQESIRSSATPEPGYQWVSNRLTIRHHKRVPRGKPFPGR